MGFHAKGSCGSFLENGDECMKGCWTGQKVPCLKINGNSYKKQVFHGKMCPKGSSFSNYVFGMNDMSDEMSSYMSMFVRWHKNYGTYS